MSAHVVEVMYGSESVALEKALLDARPEGSTYGVVTRRVDGYQVCLTEPCDQAELDAAKAFSKAFLAAYRVQSIATDRPGVGFCAGAEVVKFGLGLGRWWEARPYARVRAGARLGGRLLGGAEVIRVYAGSDHVAIDFGG